jgi:hypothetical protein
MIGKIIGKRMAATFPRPHQTPIKTVKAPKMKLKTYEITE